MKKARSRTERKALGTPSEPGIAREPVNLAAVRRAISELVGSEAVGIVRKVMGEIDVDHYTTMKYLFELAGLYPVEVQEEIADDDDSLTKTLLSRLGLEEGLLKEPEITKDRKVDALAAVGDAVE
jgi:hypothetical protein